MGYTRKQIRIILLMAAGLSSKKIAEKLGLTTGTIGSHRKSILKKSGCVNWCHFMASNGRNGQIDRWTQHILALDGAELDIELNTTPN